MVSGTTFLFSFEKTESFLVAGAFLTVFAMVTLLLRPSYRFCALPAASSATAPSRPPSGHFRHPVFAARSLSQIRSFPESIPAEAPAPPAFQPAYLERHQHRRNRHHRGNQHPDRHRGFVQTWNPSLQVYPVPSYTIPDSGSGLITSFGDHYIYVGLKKIIWDASTKFTLNKATSIAVGMPAQWRGKRDAAPGVVLANKLDIN